MQIFRVFDWDGQATGRREGGPLSVPRARQGAGRHDAPALYGAWYCSRLAVSAVAESLQPFRGHALTDQDFMRTGGLGKALAELEVDDGLPVVDLDDPAELVRRRLRPSRVASMRRPITQAIAASLYQEGAAGLAWWSTLNADWGHMTLFHERAVSRVRVTGSPQRLTPVLPAVREAAEYLGIRL